MREVTWSLILCSQIFTLLFDWRSNLRRKLTQKLKARLLVGGIHLLLIFEDSLGVYVKLSWMQRPVTLLSQVRWLQMVASWSQAWCQLQVLQFGIEVASSFYPWWGLKSTNASSNFALVKVLPFWRRQRILSRVFTKNWWLGCGAP